MITVADHYFVWCMKLDKYHHQPDDLVGNSIHVIGQSTRLTVKPESVLQITDGCHDHSIMILGDVRSSVGVLTNFSTYFSML